MYLTMLPTKPNQKQPPETRKEKVNNWSCVFLVGGIEASKIKEKDMHSKLAHRHFGCGCFGFLFLSLGILVLGVQGVFRVLPKCPKPKHP